MSASLEERLGQLVPPHALDNWDSGTGPPCPRVAPENEEQFRAVLTMASAHKLKVLPLGMGSKLGWIPPVSRVDFVLSTLGYRGVTSHEPADGTVTALAGTSMADLAAVVGEGGHHLSPSVPHPHLSTLGGVVAAGQSGNDRMRYGALRANLLGTRVMLADGTCAKSGGQLVKNVTGYDLHRAYCGSFGSLAIVLEASLRLHPLPEERALLVARRSNRGDAIDLANEIRAAAVRPITLLVHDLDSQRSDVPWTVMAVFGARSIVLNAELDLMRALCPSASIVRGSDVNPLTKSIRDLEQSSDRWPWLSLESKPSKLQEVLSHLIPLAGGCGFTVKLLLHPAVARAIVWLIREDERQTGDPALLVRDLVQLDEGLKGLQAVARWRDLPPQAAGQIPSVRPPQSGLKIMRALQSALDPQSILAPRLFQA